MSPWTQPGSPRREKQVIGVGVGIEDQPEKELLEPECLGDEERERCDQWIKLLGLHTVKCLFSKHWQHRADGIKKVMQTLRKYSTAKLAFRAKLFMVFASIVERRLADNVLQVYQATGDVLKSLVDFGEGIRYPGIGLEGGGPIAGCQSGHGDVYALGILDRTNPMAFWCPPPTFLLPKPKC